MDDPGEKDRILRQYAGIFPKNIKEFAEKIVKKKKKQINFSRWIRPIAIGIIKLLILIF